MSYQKIHELLDEQLATVTGLPTLNTENTRATVNTSVAFTRSTLLPARPDRLSIGLDGRKDLRGLYQVDLYHPLEDGAAEANAMADAVIAAFPEAVSLVDGTVSVRVVMAWRQSAGVRVGMYACPVVIEWSCIT